MCRKATRLTHQLPAGPADEASKQLASGAQNLVECFLKMRRTLGHFATDLLHILLVTLLDIFSKELPQATVAQPFIPFLGMVRHQIRHQRAGETARALSRICIEERID